MDITRQTALRREQKGGTYVLMTAAYNEEAHIEKTLQSVLAQTLLPQRWVIVSDNSNDGTDEIIKRYAKRYDFIRFLRVTRLPGHSFVSKVEALHSGAKFLDDVSYEYIGNIDADISVEATYFADLIGQFEQHSALGVTGGFVYEDIEGQFASRKINDIRNVAHAAQLVRRACYEAIGGYKVLKYGGEDWHAQTCARMGGWDVQAIPSLHIFHHRRTGAADRPYRDRFRLGRLDYSFGSDPMFEIAKCLKRLREAPYVLGAMTRLAGFVWGYISREQKAVSDDFVAFLRKEQRSRVKSLFRADRRTIGGVS